MKRKIIQIAGSTQLVSLPRAWCKQRELKKGQEVNVTETSDGLLVATEGQVTLKTKTIDLNEISILKNRLVITLYQQGYDEIRIQYSDGAQVRSIIERAIPELIGMEIIEQKPTMLILKDISGSSGEDYDTVLRRVFHILGQLIQDGSAGATAEHFLSVEQTINKFTNYCLRALSKKRTLKHEHQYMLIQNLERAADELKENGEKMTKKERLFLGVTSTYYTRLNALYYKYSLEDAEKTALLYERLKKTTPANLKLYVESLLRTYDCVININL